MDELFDEREGIKQGYTAGYDDGYKAGYEEGWELGKVEAEKLGNELGFILGNCLILRKQICSSEVDPKKLEKIIESIKEFPMENTETDREDSSMARDRRMRNVFDDEDDIVVPVTPSFTPTALLTATNDEATLCRYSAHVAGLINDPYSHHFLPPTRLHERPVKDPLINRGTSLRVASIDHALSSLLIDGIETQVLSLGAGFDTRFFNFQSYKNLVKYVEIDFEEVIIRKNHVIQQHSLPSPAFVSADMEANFPDVSLPKIASLLDTCIRTVIIAECSLMYMQDDSVKAMLRSLSLTFKSAHLIVFEPLYVGDRFGKTMEKNLSERGLPIESLMKYPTAESYISRIQSCGWKNTNLVTMAELSKNPEYSALLSAKAPLDEYEEWSLITQHYFLLTASN